MIIFLSFLMIIMLFSIRIHVKGLDSEYLSKKYTQPIKGIFVVIVFLSHVRTYAQFNHATDLWVISLLNYLGQLMVALFLFYSGYGVYNAIKKKGNQYIRSIPKNRLGKTFFDFFLSLCLFLIMDICLGIYYSPSRILLSLIGWSSIGNSAWYMFAIFSLYILTFVCFFLCKDNRFFSICLLTLCSFGYIYIMSMIKENYWSSTYLCYVAGMWYSYFKENIDKFLSQRNILYYVITVFIIVSYAHFFHVRYQRLLMFNFVAILFCLIFVFLSMKIAFHSSVLTWLGDHLFWIYILQRIPMIWLKQIQFADTYPYIFLLLCWIITVVMAYYIHLFAEKLKERIWQ